MSVTSKQTRECRIAPDALRRLAGECLQSAGASRWNADAAAAALVRADLDGIPSHGVARIPFYAEHLRRGRVDGQAKPEIIRTAPAAIKVDAGYGLAAPAIMAAIRELKAAAAESGVAVAMIGRAHHSGVLGYYVETLAEDGFAALGVANSAAAIAAPGGKSGRFGTNPIAFAFPRRGSFPLVIDLSMGAMNRGRIMLAANRREPLPEGYAFDAAGNPTTDPTAALQGTVAPIGGVKGAALAMAIDLLAGGLTDSQFSCESRSGFEMRDGPPYANGVVLVAFHPSAEGASRLLKRVEELCAVITAEDGVRLPGDRRIANRILFSSEGITLPGRLLDKMREIAARPEHARL